MRHAFFLLLATSLPATGAPTHGGPVIDMHLHAFAMDEVPAGVPACPGIGEGIKAIESAPFLDAAQKRDILYGNAARFLRLAPAQIAADHAPRGR